VGRLAYVERLTADLAERAWQHIEEVEAAGGMAKAIEAGIPKMRIEEAAARTQARIDSGQQPVIGVNRYPVDEDEPIEVLRVDNAAVRASQLAKLERLRAERDEDATRAALQRLTDAARSGSDGTLDTNLLALAIDAARAMATVGEMSAAMEEVFGRYTAQIRTIGGVYSAEAGRTRRSTRRRRSSSSSSGAGPPPAHPRREDGPGRPRPRPEGDLDGVRRPRLRRRRGPAVPDPRRGRPPGRRGRRARRRGQLAGRRAPHPGARPCAPSSTRSAART
jgi:hypothetical protein